MAVNNWSFVLTGLDFVPVGEVLNAKDRTLSLALSRLDTCSFTLRLDNQLADFIADDNECFIKAYRNGVLRFFGPVITAEEVGDNENTSLAVNAVSQGWNLGKRYVGKSARGDITFAVTPTDRGQIVGGFLDTLNSENDTHIQRGETMTSASAITYTGGPYTYMMDIINELSNSFDGFDWRIFPVENYNGGVVGSKIGSLYTAAVLGTEQPNAVFEYGTGRYNILSYRRSVSRDVQANSVAHNASAGPDAPGYPTVWSSDAASISKWGLLEAVAPGDLTDAALRHSLVVEHVNVRKNPRKLLTFTPHIDDGSGRVPQFGVDWDIGDTVRARIVSQGTIRVDGMTRVWGASFAIDNNGTERVSMTLEEDQ